MQTHLGYHENRVQFSRLVLESLLQLAMLFYCSIPAALLVFFCFLGFLCAKSWSFYDLISWRRWTCSCDGTPLWPTNNYCIFDFPGLVVRSSGDLGRSVFNVDHTAHCKVKYPWSLWEAEMVRGKNDSLEPHTAILISGLLTWWAMVYDEVTGYLCHLPISDFQFRFIHCPQRKKSPAPIFTAFSCLECYQVTRLLFYTLLAWHVAVHWTPKTLQTSMRHVNKNTPQVGQ